MCLPLCPTPQGTAKVPARIRLCQAAAITWSKMIDAHLDPLRH